MGSPVETGAVLDGRFRVERVIGTGAMGVVVAARHIALREPVAIKFLKAELTEDAVFVARFEREARAAARLRSEHIARVSDVGRLASGEPYMVMEYLVGKDLSEHLAGQGSLPLVEAAEYLLQACEALAEAHSLGIVHRDLKPANLFLTTRADGSACIKVLDFGIARFADGAASSGLSATLAGGLVGSPLYMSPEQIESAMDVDSRSDVWSLGIILFELLTGSMPFTGTNLAQICMAIVTAAPRSLRALRPDVPQGVEDLVLACLEKNREARPSSVAEFARRLAEFGPEHGRLSAMRAERIAGLLPTQVTVAAPAVPPGSFPRRALMFGGACVAAIGVGVFISARSPEQSGVDGAPPSNSARPPSADQATSGVVGEAASAARKGGEEPTVSLVEKATASSSATAPTIAPPATSRPRATKATPSRVLPGSSSAAPRAPAESKPIPQPSATSVDQRRKSLGGRL